VIYLLRGRSSTGFALSALFMGCALATKWYYLPGWLLVLLLALQEDGNYRDPKTVLFLTCIYLFLPLCVYLASYYPWFGRGYTLGEFADFTINAYRSLQSYQPGSYDQQLLFLNHISAGAWFTGAVIVGRGTYLSDSLGEFIVYMNDLPIWVLAIPALLSMGIIAVRKRSWLIAAPVLLFFATYVLFLFVDRPVFLYSAAPLLPFAFTAIAYGVTKLAEKFHVRIYHVTLAAMLAWSLYLYPFVTAKKVPVAPYSFILNHGDIKIH
jgi:dolichyl-phosphate-mannose-protein mannosyltransferase